MPYRICKTVDIESGHMLSKHPDKCRFPHGHTRKVEFVLEADDLDTNEMVCDFKLLKKLVSDRLDSLNHAMCMNTEDPAYTEFKERYGDRVIGFEKRDPTSEVMAEYLFEYCRQALNEYALSTAGEYALRESVRVVSVRVWETASSWAEFSR